MGKSAKFLHADNEGSDCAHVPADLSLRWLHMSEGTFSHVVAHINYLYQHHMSIKKPQISYVRYFLFLHLPIVHTDTSGVIIFSAAATFALLNTCKQLYK